MVMFQKDKMNVNKDWYSRHCASLKKLVLLLDDILHSFVSISEVGSNFLLFSLCLSSIPYYPER